MPEAWELAPDTKRTADETVTFILFCEDEVCEPHYFTQFQKPGKVKVNVTGDQQSGFRNYMNTLLYCEQNGLLDRHGGGYVLKPDVTKHIWSVFDRDTDLTRRHRIAADNMVFTQSILVSQQTGINVAWSNDAFELWLLLHFEDVDPQEALPRHVIYERLTAIFKGLAGQSPAMASKTGHAQFDYKNSFKKRNEFVLYVLPELENRRTQAEQRAAMLDASFPQGHLYHDCNPCTKVYHLVQSILSFH